jgi:hypothetical protein
MAQAGTPFSAGKQTIITPARGTSYITSAYGLLLGSELVYLD